MNNKIKKIMASVLIFLLAVPMFCNSRVMAAESAKISVSSANVSVGDDFTINVSISASSIIVGGEVNLSYDPSVIELTSGYGGGGNAKVQTAGEDSMTLGFRALAPGSTKISVSSDVIAIGTEIKTATTSSAGSVTVSAPTNYSTDNTLASLEISPGVLSPAFSPDVTSYTTSVAADCEKLIVSAIANDSNAKVSVSGTRMDPGKNTTTVTVTAQNGSKKVYKISTTREAGESASEEAITPDGSTTESDTNAEPEVNPLTKDVTIDGKDYKIVDDYSKYPLPDGYEVMDYEYEGHQIQVGKGVQTKLILMYLENTDGDGTSGFFVYDSVAKTFTPYREVAQPQITYAILPITDSIEKPEGYTQTTYEINGQMVDVLMAPSGKNCLFYGVSSLGVTGWFEYVIEDGTIQTYLQLNKPQNQADAIDKDGSGSTKLRIFQTATAVTGTLCILLLAAVVVLARKVTSNKKTLISAIKNNRSSDLLEDDADDLLDDDYEEVDDEEDLVSENRNTGFAKSSIEMAAATEATDVERSNQEESDQEESAQQDLAQKESAQELSAQEESDKEEEMFQKVSQALASNLDSDTAETEDDLETLEIEDLDELEFSMEDEEDDDLDFLIDGKDSKRNNHRKK